MAFSTVSLSGSETKLYYEDPANPDTFIELVNAVSVGALPQKRSFIDNTPIGSKNKTFIAGDDETSESAIVLNDVPGDAEQQAFHQMAVSQVSVNMRVDWRNGRRFSFEAQLGGFEPTEPSRGEAYKISYPYQRNGDVVATEF